MVVTDAFKSAARRTACLRTTPAVKKISHTARPARLWHSAAGTTRIPQLPASAVALVPRRALLLGISVAAVGFLAQGLLRHRQGTLFAVLPSLSRPASASPVVAQGTTSRQTPSMNRTQNDLVDYLKADGVIKHADVERAMRAVDRQHFCDPTIPRNYRYMDHPLPIGYGETISAPHMHATCLELLREHLFPGARVLDVGSGSGYLSAAMAEMVGEGGKVLGYEKHPELAELSVTNVRAATPHWLESGVVELRAGNVLGEVLEAEEPFDAIHVGAAAAELPEILVRKLKPGGRMVIPVGPQWDYQVMECVDKDRQGKIHKHNLMYVRYVPLTKPGETDTEE